VVSATADTLERHPDFLRLLIVFAAQAPEAGDGEIQAVVRRVREHALDLLRAQIAAAFGDDPRSPVPAHERHRPLQDLRKQGAQLLDRAQVLGQGMQAPGRVRVVQNELDRRGEVPVSSMIRRTAAEVAIRRIRADRHDGAAENGWQRSMLETSRPGIFAVGDVRAGSAKRVAAAVGEGAMAIRLAFERVRPT
jgi:hypothetical protein